MSRALRPRSGTADRSEGAPLAPESHARLDQFCTGISCRLRSDLVQLSQPRRIYIEVVGRCYLRPSTRRPLYLKSHYTQHGTEEQGKEGQEGRR